MSQLVRENTARAEPQLGNARLAVSAPRAGKPSSAAPSGRSCSPGGSRLLHPHGQGFWWLAVEPPLLVILVGIVFALLVAPGRASTTWARPRRRAR